MRITVRCYFTTRMPRDANWLLEIESTLVRACALGTLGASFLLLGMGCGIDTSTGRDSAGRNRASLIERRD